MPGDEETAPAISHYNFHRLHGAQIAVFSGTRRKPVLIRRKPGVQFEKIVFPHALGKVRLLLTRRKPVFWQWKPVKNRPKNMGFR